LPRQKRKEEREIVIAMGLAAEQGANLDGDSDDIRQAVSAAATITI